MKSRIFQLICCLYVFCAGFGVPGKYPVPPVKKTVRGHGAAMDYPPLLPSLPTYIMPSPQAMAMARYGDYPVNYNTGLVDMSVPIYEIKTKKLNLSINMSFHASGRMADEVNGMLGSRWLLNFGIVTRTIQGRPDEWTVIKPFAISPTLQPTYEQLYASNVESSKNYLTLGPLTKYDTEYDIFHYSLPNGKNGQFILKDENGVKKPMLIPYSGLKIELTRGTISGSQDTYAEVRITDTDGTVYYYGDMSSNNYRESTNGISVNNENVGLMNLSWYLKKIVSADGTDEINFNYTPYGIRRPVYNHYITVPDRLRDYEFGSSPGYRPDDADFYGLYLMDYLNQIPIDDMHFVDTEYINAPYITSISFTGGTLNFNYRLAPEHSYNNKMLESIELIGTPTYRKFRFDTQLETGETYLYYLKKLEFISRENNVEKVEQQYRFDYYAPQAWEPPHTATEDVQFKDEWGYYSSGGGRLGALIPAQTIDIVRPTTYGDELLKRVISQDGIERQADLNSRKMGMLKSISYPTGGTTTFEYELNRYRGVIHNDGPGLRIKTIRNTVESGQATYRRFEYGSGEDGFGYINQAYELRPYVPEETFSMFFWEFYSPYYDSNLKSQAGYRVHRYSSEHQIKSSGIGESGLLYDVVTEYSGSESRPERKDVYYYESKTYDKNEFIINDSYYVGMNSPFPKYYTDPSHLWRGGELGRKESFRLNQATNSYELATIEKYSYNPVLKDEAWDMPTYRHINLSVDYSLSYPYDKNRQWYLKEKDYHENVCSVIGYGFRKYVSGANVPTGVTREVYDNGGVFSTRETLTPEDIHLQIKRREVVSSNGLNEVFTYEYPFDNSTIAVNSKMTAMNIVSIPTKIVRTVNNVQQEQKRTVFKEWYTNVIQPQYEYYTNRANTEKLLLQFHQYSTFGNPLDFSYLSDQQQAYIWGYNGLYPIAKIENASYQDVLTILGQTTLNNLNSMNVTDAYIQTTMATLRNHADMKKARVTSYTYRPFVGMSSMTGPRGLTEYYSYDSYDKLQHILDFDRNITNSYQYHYKPNNAYVFNLAYTPVQVPNYSLCSSSIKDKYYLLNVNNIPNPGIGVGTILYSMDGVYAKQGYYSLGTGIYYISGNDGKVTSINPCN